MRILLVDDEPKLLESLARFLGSARPGWQVLTAADGTAALALLSGQPVDLLVTDIRMPALDGMALLEHIRRDPRLAGLPVILASGQAERGSIRDAMHRGADDYLTKPFTGEEVLQAIEGRLRRLRPAEPAAGEPGASLHQLTEREQEIMGLIGRGLATKEIAARLRLSPNTVSVHRAHIMRKLDLHTSAALAALAVRARIG